MRRPMFVGLAIAATASCAPPPGGPADPVAPAAVVVSPSGSLPPLDPPETHPYQAPDFRELPPAAEAGRWERIPTGTQPLAIPFPPTPAPPTPFPGEYYGGGPYYDISNVPVPLRPGQTLDLKTDAANPSWGVLEPERAKVDASGRLTALAPGPVHVYAEVGGRRKYMLLAVADPAVAARTLVDRAPFGLDERGAWATVIRSREDWQAYSPSTPLPEGVDFGSQALLAIHEQSNTGDGTEAAVVTRLVGNVLELVLPQRPFDACACDSMATHSLWLLPFVPPAGMAVKEVFMHHEQAISTVPVTGPTPTPPPSPTPTPDPFNSLPAGAPSPPVMPPYPPGPMPPPGGCPDPAFAMGGFTPPLILTWYDAPTTGPSTWEPILTPGGTLRLFTRGVQGALRWQSADPRIADVAANGLVTGKRAGAALISATVDAGTIRALLPVEADPPPALRFRFRADWEIPANDAPPGARVIRDAAAWGKLFKGELLYNLPWNPPPVDFSRYDVVALVDERTTYGESRATLTHVAKDGSEVHVVFPGIQGPGLGSHRSTYLFLTGKLAPNATVRVHTLCDP